MAYHRVMHPSPTSENPGRDGGAWVTINRSCDWCTLKKRKCGGNGVDPCRRCKARGRGHQCVYSKRKQQPLRQRRCQEGEEGAIQCTPPQSLKRYRMSASRATGLVGLQESALLSAFFDCMSFMPLTSPSVIREAMIKIMAVPAARRSPTDSRGGDSGSSTRQLPMDTSTCTFWCAVALGGLVQGRPIETVASYARHAESALENHSGIVTTDVAKAWAILGYLHGFCGDVAKFLEYLRCTGAYLRTYAGGDSPDGVPVGFTEMIGHADDVAFLEGRDASGAYVKAFCSDFVSPSPVGPITTEAKVYQWVMLTYRRFDQAFLADVYADRGEIAGHPDRRDDEETLADGNPGETTSSAPLLVSLVDNATVTSSFITCMLERLRETSAEFEWLEDVVDRSSIGSGMGGIIINGTLVYSKAAKGDVAGVLDRMTRCAEAFERYPGVCRFPMGLHMAHVVIATLAAVSSQALYDKVRTAYNAMRPAGQLPIPPLAEYQGLDICCDHVYCRSWERLIQHGDLTFCAPPLHEPHQEANPCLDSEHPDCGGISSAMTRTPETIADRCDPLLLLDGQAPDGSETGEPSALKVSRPPETSTPGLALNGGDAEPDKSIDTHSRDDRGLCGSCSITWSTLDPAEEGVDTEELISSADWLDVTHAMLLRN